MYSWIWRRLPGGTFSKLALVVVIAAVILAVLWFLVFPWAALHLPIDRVGVTG